MSLELIIWNVPVTKWNAKC